MALSRSKKVICHIIMLKHGEQKSKIKLELRGKVCENKDFYGVVMPSEGTKISDFNKYR